MSWLWPRLPKADTDHSPVPLQAAQVCSQRSIDLHATIPNLCMQLKCARNALLATFDFGELGKVGTPIGSLPYRSEPCRTMLHSAMPYCIVLYPTLTCTSSHASAFPERNPKAGCQAICPFSDLCGDHTHVCRRNRSPDALHKRSDHSYAN